MRSLSEVEMKFLSSRTSGKSKIRPINTFFVQFWQILDEKLLCTFLQIAVTAEHLAVFRHGFAAFAPRCDVVGVHFVELECFTADCALVILFFISSQSALQLESRTIHNSIAVQYPLVFCYVVVTEPPCKLENPFQKYCFFCFRL